MTSQQAPSTYQITYLSVPHFGETKQVIPHIFFIQTTVTLCNIGSVHLLYVRM